MPSGNTLTDDAFARTKTAVLQWEKFARNRQPRELQPPVDAPRPFVFWNATNEAVPPYALMRVATDVQFNNGFKIPSIVKPDTTFGTQYLVNGDFPIAATSAGTYQTGPDVLVAIDASTFAIGGTAGPKPGQWTANATMPELLGVRSMHTAGSVARGLFSPTTRVIGKLTSGLSPAGTATMKIWVNNGSGVFIAGPFDDITVSDWLMKVGTTAIASGKKIWADWEMGAWIVKGAECA